MGHWRRDTAAHAEIVSAGGNSGRRGANTCLRVDERTGMEDTIAGRVTERGFSPCPHHAWLAPAGPGEA